MKVKALVSMCLKNFTSIPKGQVIELDNKVAKRLEKDGLVEIIKEEKKKVKKEKKEEVAVENVEVEKDGE